MVFKCYGFLSELYERLFFYGKSSVGIRKINRQTFLERPLNRTYNEQNYTSAQVNLNGEFNTGKINHKVLFGADADYGVADLYLL
jgi:outer membrane receptor protein involved in Fe transport